MKKRLITFLFTLIALMAFQTTVSANDIKFVQVTDSHYSSGNDFKRNVMESTIKDINTLKGVSFVVFTGDNIDKANPEYLKEFVKIVNKLDVPYYMVIGNHEVFKSGDLSKLRYMEIIKENNIFYRPSKPNYKFTKNGFLFLIVDGAKEVIPGANGYYREDTLEWVDKELTKHSKMPAIILQHFPLVPPKEMVTHKTYQAEKYLEMLDKHNNVIAVVSGHYHINGEQMKNGIYHISTPTLLNEPYQYKIIDIVTTKGFSPMIYTQLRDVNIQPAE